MKLSSSELMRIFSTKGATVAQLLSFEGVTRDNAENLYKAAFTPYIADIDSNPTDEKYFLKEVINLVGIICDFDVHSSDCLRAFLFAENINKASSDLACLLNQSLERILKYKERAAGQWTPKEMR